jgi:hypothetical protein
VSQTRLGRIEWWHGAAKPPTPDVVDVMLAISELGALSSNRL